MQNTPTPTNDKAPGLDPDLADFAVTAPPSLDPKSASTTDDLAAFRTDCSHLDMQVAKADFTVVRSYKPTKSDWCYILSEPWRFPAFMLQREGDDAPYLLTPQAVRSLDDETPKRVVLVAYVTSLGVWGLWPVPMPREDGSTCLWHETAREIAFTKTGRWQRVMSSKKHGAYLTVPAPIQLAAPELPPVDMAGLVKIAFKGRLIRDPNDDVLRRARGEII